MSKIAHFHRKFWYKKPGSQKQKYLLHLWATLGFLLPVVLVGHIYLLETVTKFLLLFFLLQERIAYKRTQLISLYRLI